MAEPAFLAVDPDNPQFPALYAKRLAEAIIANGDFPTPEAVQQQIETALSEITPDEVTDGVMASVAGDPESLFSGELSATIVQSGAAIGGDGYEYVFLAGVIRNQGDGNGWQLLLEETFHHPVNIESIETFDHPTAQGGYIRVHYSIPAGYTTVGGYATVDETLARNGFQVGTSVTNRYMDIRISQAPKGVQDLITWDSATQRFVSNGGNFTAGPLDADGKFTLTHTAIDQAVLTAVSIADRGSGVRFVVSPDSGATTTTSVTLQALDASPAFSAYVEYVAGTTNAWVVTGDMVFVSYASGVLTLGHPPIPARAVNRVGVDARVGTPGAPIPQVSSASSPLTPTQVILEFRDSAGARVTTPSSTMRAYVTHGGATNAPVSAAALTAADRAYVVHGGGGTVEWKPGALDTIKYPQSNIWLFGVMGRPAA